MEVVNVMSTQTISNSQFLTTLSHSKRSGTFLWVTHFDGNPDNAKGQEWGGTVYIPAVMAKQVDDWDEQNTYFSVAALKPDENGEIFRRKDYFDRLLVLVADDVELEDLSGSVSYIITTSPGKHQVGILIDGDDPDAANQPLVDAVIKGMAAKGYVKVDKSGNNPVRYVRLPIGTNQKPRETGHFRHQLTHWDAQAVYSLRDAASVFGINDVDALITPERERTENTERSHQADNLGQWTKNILEGVNLHDSINQTAASLIATGMPGGAVVNHLRSLMELSQAVRDERFKSRLEDIPRAVSTAEKNFKFELAPIPNQEPQGEKRLDYIHAGQIETQDERFDDELVERVLMRDGMSVIYGDSNSGKTFLAVHLAACIARGDLFLGRRTVPGMVLYLATEAAGSVIRRLKAYKKHHKIESLDVVVVKSPISLFDGAADTNLVCELIQQLERQYNKKIVMVIGDTMARISAGANENSGEDMGVILKHADHIKLACQTHFLWIHHNGKNAAAGMRGWSGIRAAIDTEIEVIEDKDSGVRTLEITKQRDIEGKGDRYGFRLESIDIGVSQWGVTRSSCIVVASDEVPAKIEKGKRPSVVEREIIDLLMERGEPMSRPQLSKKMEERGRAKSGVYSALNNLLASGKLHNDNGMVWPK